MEHLPPGHVQELLLRQKEPVAVSQPVTGIDRELVEEPATERLHLHVVPDRHLVPTEPDRPAEELPRNAASIRSRTASTSPASTNT